MGFIYHLGRKNRPKQTSNKSMAKHKDSPSCINISTWELLDFDINLSNTYLKTDMNEAINPSKFHVFVVGMFFLGIRGFNLPPSDFFRFLGLENAQAWKFSMPHFFWFQSLRDVGDSRLTQSSHNHGSGK